MTDKQLLEQALEALEFFKELALSMDEIERAENPITAIRARLEQPEQEPDEWLTGCPECGMDSGCDCDSGTWNPPAAPVQGHA